MSEPAHAKYMCLGEDTTVAEDSRSLISELESQLKAQNIILSKKYRAPKLLFDKNKELKAENRALKDANPELAEARALQEENDDWKDKVELLCASLDVYERVLRWIETKDLILTYMLQGESEAEYLRLAGLKHKEITDLIGSVIQKVNGSLDPWRNTQEEKDVKPIDSLDPWDGISRKTEGSDIGS